MKIYNQEKTQELNQDEINFELGYLKDDKLIVNHHEATPFKRGRTAIEIAQELKSQDVGIEIGFDGNPYRIVTRYDDGGTDVEPIMDEPDTPAQDAYNEYEDIQVYVPYTAAELKKIADDKRHAELKTELSKIMEDIEQEQLGLVRDDYAEKKARAAEIINELRVLEGKEAREVKEE